MDDSDSHSNASDCLILLHFFPHWIIFFSEFSNLREKNGDVCLAAAYTFFPQQCCSPVKVLKVRFNTFKITAGIKVFVPKCKDFAFL